MATPIGMNAVTAIARRYILPEIVDQVYSGNAVAYRLYKANKRIVRGGTQIEVPLMYARFAAGGPYQGFDLLDVSPSDTLLNGAWDWKQLYVPVTVDGLTLIKTDSPEAIADFIRLYFEQAEIEMAELISDGIWSDGTNPRKIDGLQLAVDSTGTYGGLSRSTYSWWAAGEDSSTTTLTLAALQTAWGTATSGARHPTLIATTQANYNRYWNLLAQNVRYPVQPGGEDELMMSAGFTNLLFNQAPLLVDSRVPANHIFLLNEEYISMAVSPRGDFYMEDFQKPIQQDAMTAKILWAGNLIVTNCARQFKFTAISA